MFNSAWFQLALRFFYVLVPCCCVVFYGLTARDLGGAGRRIHRRWLTPLLIGQALMFLENILNAVMLWTLRAQPLTHSWQTLLTLLSLLGIAAWLLIVYGVSQLWLTLRATALVSAPAPTPSPRSGGAS